MEIADAQVRDLRNLSLLTAASNRLMRNLLEANKAGVTVLQLAVLLGSDKGKVADLPASLNMPELVVSKTLSELARKGLILKPEQGFMVEKTPKGERLVIRVAGSFGARSSKNFASDLLEEMSAIMWTLASRLAELAGAE